LGAGGHRGEGRPLRILVLGGTTEARLLSARLAADVRFDATLSLAGRTSDPVAHAVPIRVGGFGGVEGLARHLQAEAVDVLVDATHPFAARISWNAWHAAGQAGVSLLVLSRPGWSRRDGDRWTKVENLEAAALALGPVPRNVLLTLGRQELASFLGAPQHHYLVRSIEPVEPPLDLPSVRYLLARGPFQLEDELALLRDEKIEAIVTKDSGAAATHAKIEAARLLGIEVVMVARPERPPVPALESVDAVVAALDHLAASGQLRGE